MIVFITIPWFAPAYKAGGPIQSIVNLVSNYTDNITYKIFCSNKDLDATKLENITANKWSKFNNNTEVFYASNFSNALLKSEIENINPDALFIIGIFSWQYNILPLLMQFKNKKILSVRGMLHPGALSQKSIKKNIFINILKALKITNKIIFHATDEEEEIHLKNIFGQKTTVNIASNFGNAITKSNTIHKQKGFLKLITVALVSPMKNHLLVLKSLLSCNANIEYSICGAIKDNAYWQLCLNEIATMPNNIIVNYIGEVKPQDVGTELQKNHIFIMPSKSENFGHAVFEALSLKLPVITSKFTPWNNLQENEAGINVDNDTESISTAINYFANMDNELYQKYAENTYNYFLTNNKIDLKMQSYAKLFSI